jgi:hypothetical protein
MKLLDTSKAVGNSKLAKTNKYAKEKLGMPLRFAGLSMLPVPEICPGSKAAGCMDGCLKTAGLASVYTSINDARAKRTEFWLKDQEGFLSQLRHELANFDKLCKRTGVQGVVRLNVLSDISWESAGIPQSFPDLRFYDYTKVAHRLRRKLPDNYDLTFSYSDRPQYRNQVDRALVAGARIAVVFRGQFPETFLGRPVIDGDEHDVRIFDDRKVIVGLKAKGKAKTDTSGFVVDTTNMIPTRMVA